MLSVDFSFLLLFCFVLFFRLCHVHTYLLFSPVNAHAEIRTNTLIHTQTHTPAHTYALFDYQLHISLSDVFKVMYGQESHQVNDFNLRSDNQSVLLEIDTKEKKLLIAHYQARLPLCNCMATASPLHLLPAPQLLSLPPFKRRPRTSANFHPTEH